MKLSENFTLEELIYSDTAKKYNIDNKPNDEQLNNLVNLTNKILQPIRNKFGKPIKINSGFRCEKLNKKVGGASNSDHKYGAACDITCDNNLKLWGLILNMINNGELKCRQVIWEKGTKNYPAWVHISINNNKNSAKNNEVLYLY